MYDHIAQGLKDLAQEARRNRFKRLTTREIELLDNAAIKFRTLEASLKDSRTANELLQTQLDRLKEHIPEYTMQLLLNG